MRVIVLAGLLLSACTTAGGVVRDRPVETKVPVRVTCVDKSTIPPEPAKVGNKLTNDSRVNEPILMDAAIGLRLWGERLFGMVNACAF